MESGRQNPPLAQLWQLPLLLFSLGLFAYAAYLFVDPKPGPTIAQKMLAARNYLKQERPEAAIAQLNPLLDSGKLTPPQEGACRMLLGEALETGQRLNRVDIAANHRRIIEQTRRAISLGIEADTSATTRLAESSAALGRNEEAIGYYNRLMSQDVAHVLKWQRRMIELQLLQGHGIEAAASIDEYAKNASLTDAERAWALGEKAHVMIDRGRFDEARQLLEQTLKLESSKLAGNEAADLGRFNYWLGYCAWKLAQPADAEKYLRVARDQLRGGHPLDGDAAYLLGVVRQGQKDFAGANLFYAAVLQSYMDAPVARPARLGRGVCRIALGEEDAGLTDLTDIIRYIKQRETVPPSLVEQAIAALQQAVEMLTNSGNYSGALDLMICRHELQPALPGDFFLTLGRLYEQRAAQMEAKLTDLGSEEKSRRQEAIRQLRTKAADGFIAYSRSMVLKDDKGYGQAMWKGIELYERAADLPRVINALEAFAAERPDDSNTPDALLRLGQAYHAAGLFDKAIAAYRHNQFRYAKSLAALESGVPLARALIAKGPESYKKAEDVLRGVIEDNPQVTPAAQEFREALIELARLYYDTSRYELAVSRLEEATQRYPDDLRKGQLLFLMADSYRKSAVNLDQQIKAAKAQVAASDVAAQPPGAVFDIAEASRASSQRLERAKDLYQQVVDFHRLSPPADPLAELYLKLAYFYRADCVYDLGQYAQAIKWYDAAAFRYQDDPSALAAHVQIVNANVALGRLEEAKAANERAKWMLRRMPGSAFDQVKYSLPRSSWEQWLTWSGQSGMWK